MSPKPVSLVLIEGLEAEAYAKKIWNRFVRFVDTQNRELCGQPEDNDIDGTRLGGCHERERD